MNYQPQSTRHFPHSVPRTVFTLALLLAAGLSHAQAQGNGTTVFRCVDLNGVVSFADAPCRDSASKRLRIEHSMIQSAPISMGDQQRLRALEARLASGRKRKAVGDLADRKRRQAERSAHEQRCTEATTGLTEIRKRKRRGYPVTQARRIEAEEQALRGEIKLYCE